jgi:hypothetical protein
LVAYSGKFFIAAKFRRPLGELWNPAAGEAEDRRNEERHQGHDEYDLCGGERGSGDDAEAERASRRDQLPGR